MEDTEGLLTPVRRLMQYVYCRRLAYLEWVQQEWKDNYYTEHGRFVHRRVDAYVETEDAPKTRAVHLAAPVEGLVTKLDLLETEDNVAVPVEFKRGQAGAHGPPLTEKVQLCAQGLVCKENGWDCNHGFIYYNSSRERVRVEFDSELIKLTRSFHDEMRTSFRMGGIPEPLVNDARCEDCSLNSICLPEEVNFLRRRSESVRPLWAAHEEGYPLHVSEHGSKVGISGDELVIHCKGSEIGRVRMSETSEICIHGNCQISSQALRVCAREGVPVSFFSYGNWFVASLQGMMSKNVDLRRAQYQTAFDEERCLQLARYFVTSKIHNQRVFLRRNVVGLSRRSLEEMKELKIKAARCQARESLLGLEGLAAKIYFASLPGALKNTSVEFSGRHRRPPTDPVNAVLSFCYAVLARECAVALHRAGFDPYQGFYHQPRYGRQSLALDLMEEFRTLIADSVTLRVFNTGRLDESDFLRAGRGFALKKHGKKRLLQSLEKRMTEEITHPVFGYKASYRRCLDLQARLLGRYLLGELESYPALETR